MAGPHRYEKVDEDGEDITAEQPMLKSLQPAASGPGKKTLITLYVLVSVLLLAVLGLGSLVVQDRHAEKHSSTTSNITGAVANLTTPAEEVSKPSVNDTTSIPFTNIKGCGGNADEARALGCVYDVMMQLWMAPECYDSALTERYLGNNTWTWYADASGENIYSDEEIRLGNHHVVYVAQDYHKKHCVFAWEKLVRTLRVQGPMIEELISFDHVKHCEMQTLFRTDYVRGVSAPTGFTRCAYYDTWKSNIPPNKHDHDIAPPQ